MKTKSIQARWRKVTLPLLTLTTLLITGCASVASNQRVSTEAEAVSASGPGIAAVLQQPADFQQDTVRWGGTIASMEIRQDETWLEVIERPLNNDGVPVLSSLSSGRFFAVVPGFLEPADYRAGQAITVTGSVNGSDNRKIGETNLDYPKIAVSDQQLWTSNTRLARANRGGKYRPYYYGPLLSSVSIGIGSRSSFGFRGRFGHRSRFGFGGHRGFRGRRGHGLHRGHRRFLSGSGKYKF